MLETLSRSRSGLWAHISYHTCSSLMRWCGQILYEALRAGRAHPCGHWRTDSAVGCQPPIVLCVYIFLRLPTTWRLECWKQVTKAVADDQDGSKRLSLRGHSTSHWLLGEQQVTRAVLHSEGIGSIQAQMPRGDSHWPIDATRGSCCRIRNVENC